MSTKLRLGPLPRTAVVRLTITLSATVKADLDRYAQLYGNAYGDKIDAATLAPHMLAAFMDRDRTFRRSRQVGPASESSEPPASTAAATSSAKPTPSDASSSR